MEEIITVSWGLVVKAHRDVASSSLDFYSCHTFSCKGSKKETKGDLLKPKTSPIASQTLTFCKP